MKVLLPEGGEIYREYDAADRLVTEIHYEKKSGIANRTKFAYDKAGNLVRITDSLGRNTIIAYDLLNREIRRTERDGHVMETNTYDQNGRLLSVIQRIVRCRFRQIIRRHFRYQTV